jgi:thiol-disulfide isomerase/thioredoxin
MVHSLLFLLVALSAGDDVTAKFVPEGVTQKMGGYRPVRAEMDQAADIVRKAPEGLSQPAYGYLEFGGKQYAFILDQPEDGEHALFVDSNADGDLTNDPAAEWQAREQGNRKMFDGSAAIDLGEGKVGKINLYRFDPTDPSREALKNTVLYYADFGSEYTFELDGQEFTTFVGGAISQDDSLWIDRDKNGQQSYNFERVQIGAPFNFTGTSYVFSVEGSTLKLDKSEKDLPMAPMPPNLALGERCLEFTAKLFSSDDEIEFPKSFAGKIVMLDFWATWCGPCIAEIPNMKEAYESWHDEGFEILGISFDFAEMDEKLKEFLHERELPWPQIYDGKGWQTELGARHDVSGIPFVLLVDGDSGEILGTSRQLRGAGLSTYIGEQLAKKKSGDK